ncbi:hypothetical protein [Actinosynnema sp. NPDC023587]|uniref:hypothetical protein n=1 Tax=Actinosynnema sp. NPDC023587 TaxID=3154695 RepID=UPI0033FA4A45
MDARAAVGTRFGSSFPPCPLPSPQPARVGDLERVTRRSPVLFESTRDAVPTGLPT